MGCVERLASNAVAPDIHHNRESMNACPSHSHRSAIGLDNPRFGAKCAIEPAATNQSKLGAGIPGQPGGKSGPAVKPSTATTGSGVEFGGGRNQDAAKVPGLPGSKSGPAVKSPPTQPRPRSRRRLRPAGRGAGETPIRVRMLRRDYSSMSSTRREASSAFISASTAGSYLPAASSRGLHANSRGYPASPAPWLGCLIKMPVDRGTCANKGVLGPLRSDREERKCGKLATLSPSA